MIWLYDQVIFILYVMVNAEDAAVGHKNIMPIMDIYFLILNFWLSLLLFLLSGSHRNLSKQLSKVVCQE